ncbi:MAG: hypothetical protein HDQ88_01000 [Clostridia bacterium]|nr:hypothetical protein [Clostridia bacterium]
MNELTVKQENLLSSIKRGGLSQLIKPLTKEIYLADTHVSGLLFRNESPYLNFQEGEELTLKRENTTYNELTVAVYQKDKKIGELSEFHEEVYARLLDAGKALKAKVKFFVVEDNFQVLSISIYMIDF